MNRPNRIFQKRFVVFCEGDTEYHYIENMKKRDGIQIVLKPINMHGGGYTNFLKRIKTESQMNSLAKFILIDADRLLKHPEEKECFFQLFQYCMSQNKRGIPHFVVLNNPNFEYIACLHIFEYKGQDVVRFLLNYFNLKSIEDLKNNIHIYDILNQGENSYSLVINRLNNKKRLLKNNYIIKKKNYTIEVISSELHWENQLERTSNFDEFFDVIDW